MATTNKKENGNIFNEEEIKNFAGYYNSLKQVHNRLIAEGYQIDTKKMLIIPPNKRAALEMLEISLKSHSICNTITFTKNDRDRYNFFIINSNKTKI